VKWYIKFHQNRRSFARDITKTFWSLFGSQSAFSACRMEKSDLHCNCNWHPNVH